MKIIMKENLIVNGDKKAPLNWFKYEYKLPVAFINSKTKDRASRNIVGVRELVPEIVYGTIIYFIIFYFINRIYYGHHIFESYSFCILVGPSFFKYISFINIIRF